MNEWGGGLKNWIESMSTNDELQIVSEQKSAIRVQADVNKWNKITSKFIFNLSFSYFMIQCVCTHVYMYVCVYICPLWLGNLLYVIGGKDASTAYNDGTRIYITTQKNMIRWQHMNRRIC